MVLLVFVRGPPAVGKTTICSLVISTLKKKNFLNCAYIAEDTFRKQLQYKYKASDMIVHTHSVMFIQTLITQLLSVDSYDVIVIEGLFRYKEVIDAYEKWTQENNFSCIFLEFTASSESLHLRDNARGTKSNDLDAVHEDIQKAHFSATKYIDAEKSVDEVTHAVIHEVLNALRVKN